MRSTWLVLAFGLLASRGYAQSGRIDGHVVDLLGNPLPGAVITAVHRGETRVQNAGGNDASFQFSNLPLGAVTLEITHRGFYKERMIVDVRRDFSIHLLVGLLLGDLSDPRDLVVEGDVRGSDGAPRPGAAVSVTAAFNSRVQSNVQADKNGHYKARLRTVGQYEIKASHKGQVGVLHVFVTSIGNDMKRFDVTTNMLEIRPR